MRTHTVSILFALLVPCSGLLAGDTWGSESLRGVRALSKVAVSMAYCPDFNLEFAVGGIDLKKDIELKLRIARIVTDAQATPMLLLNIHCLPITAQGQHMGFAVHVQLQLMQYGIVEGSKQRLFMGSWQTVDSRVCSKDCSGIIRGIVKDATDEFLVDHLKANEAK